MGAVNKRPMASKRATRCSSRSNGSDEDEPGPPNGPEGIGVWKKRQKTSHNRKNLNKSPSPNNHDTYLDNSRTECAKGPPRANSASGNGSNTSSRGGSQECGERFDLLTVTTTTLNHKERSRIYNFGCRQKPAELFRKDLISAMKMADSGQLNESDYILITDTWKEEWEKGVQVPVNPEALPTASFRLVHPAKTANGCKTINENAKMPSNWICSEPKQAVSDAQDGNDQVGYELDLIDLAWRDLMAQTCVPPIPELLIESTITELERQCAENMKNHNVGIEFSETVVCNVCRSPHGEDHNEMIFCDTCNVCVHQACYGVVEIPDGEWYCQACRELGHSDKASCQLCPNKGGAILRTPDGEWAHISCALWVVSQHMDKGRHKDPSPCRWNNNNSRSLLRAPHKSKGNNKGNNESKPRTRSNSSKQAIT